MVRHYVAKTPAREPGVAESAVEEYFRLKAANASAPLKNAAFGRVKEPMLCKYVKGHATAEAALAALAARRRRGGQTADVPAWVVGNGSDGQPDASPTEPEAPSSPTASRRRRHAPECA